MEPAPQIKLAALSTLPEFRPGNDLPSAIVEAAKREGIAWAQCGAVIVAQKIVSKCEGRIVDLRSIRPSAEAESFARDHEKDPRLVELVLRQSKRILKMERGIIIAETHHGFVCANAGVDRSNLPEPDQAALLPEDPDASAKQIREKLKELTGRDIAVIISDTFGRPWRVGLVNVAIGVAGFQPVEDLRGKADRYGRPLSATCPAVADEIAAAAGLLMQKGAGRPVVIAQGLRLPRGEGSARELIRRPEDDLFR